MTRVDFHKDTDDFSVRVKDLPTDTETEERFTHVIVATGTFHTPNVPDCPGLDSFKGPILHSKDVKHMEDFKGKRILIIGGRWSAEDLAIQAYKFGAAGVVISWKTMPMGQDWFEFPKGIEQHPLVEKVVNNTAYFKDGHHAEFDMIIFCTGYRWHFPFLADELRLKEHFAIAYKDLYKGTLWLTGGNGKLIYIGAPYSIYSFPSFEAQAVWACKYIMGKLKIPSQEEMRADTDKWLQKLYKVDLSKFLDLMLLMTDVMEDLCETSGYPKNCIKSGEILDDWAKSKAENILTYRDKQCRSVHTGKLTPLHHTPWLEAFDDSLEAFGVMSVSNKHG